LTIYNDFLDVWCRGYYKTHKTSRKKFEMIEAELGFKFPPSYREAMISFGASDVMITLLDTIVDQNLDLRDVTEIIRPAKIYKEMIGGQKAGMPNHLIPIASDCMGNSFCFSTHEVSDSAKEIPIYFFDHDFDEVDLEADCFEDWLKAYLNIIRP
jgi:hypothetical protein